jgi:hypothetical protein
VAHAAHDVAALPVRTPAAKVFTVQAVGAPLLKRYPGSAQLHADWPSAVLVEEPVAHAVHVAALVMARMLEEKVLAAQG